MCYMVQSYSYRKNILLPMKVSKATIYVKLIYRAQRSLQHKLTSELKKDKMNAEPAKRDGKIKQQVEIEHDIRRRFSKKWGDITKDPRINFYSQESLNKALTELNGGVTNLYEYDNSGDSFFVSKDMYTSLYQTCRCGRPRTDAHSLKCLQKVQNPYLKVDQRNEFLPKIPKTSLGMYGWPKNRFTDWEISTRYTSPKYDMPGGRIDGQPYSNVFIG